MTLRKSSPARQATLRRAIAFSGVGAHSGAPSCVRISPAPAGGGVVFVDARAEKTVEALWTRVSDATLRTEIARGDARISTIEHLMAALYGLGVDNAQIEIDGAEVPALDGSASDFAAAIVAAGLERLAAPRREITIVAPVRVEDGASWAEIAPTGRKGLELDVAIDFPGAIGRQSFAFALNPRAFLRELAPARSFGFLHEAETLWRRGLALGAALENCVVFGDHGPLNPHGLRFANECARHKALDAIGDLALIGARLNGGFRSYRGGHSLTLALVERLMATPSAYRRSDPRDLCAPEPRREQRITA